MPMRKTLKFTPDLAREKISYWCGKLTSARRNQSSEKAVRVVNKIAQLQRRCRHWNTIDYAGTDLPARTAPTRVCADCGGLL